MKDIHILDPSLVHRPDISDEEKKKLGIFHETTFMPESRDLESFRIFSEQNEQVKKTYKLMHTNQTYEFVQQKRAKWLQFNKAKMTIMEGLEFLNALIDESDPDVDVPNIYHAFQTAERIRERHPDKDWFHLVGLIHDLGKVMAMWEEPQEETSPDIYHAFQTAERIRERHPDKDWFHLVRLIHDLGKVMAMWGVPQWCVVGDTFPIGCAPDPSIAYGLESFRDNPDMENPLYNSKLGVYSDKCGLDTVVMSWGHDEYMYNLLLHNKCTIPEAGLNMIRFHSFYPWHTSGAYWHLCNDKDEEMMKWIKEFNQFDLYSKVDKLPDMDELRPYYQSLIDKYCPGKLEW